MLRGVVRIYSRLVLDYISVAITSRELTKVQRLDLSQGGPLREVMVFGEGWSLEIVS